MRWLTRVLAVVGALAMVSFLAYSAFHGWRRKNVGRVQRGYEVADRNGCFSCHGPGGIKGMANPGHAEEEVPPWSGGLMTMYAENEGEIREWILDGLPRRSRESCCNRCPRDPTGLVVSPPDRPAPAPGP